MSDILVMVFLFGVGWAIGDILRFFFYPARIKPKYLVSMQRYFKARHKRMTSDLDEGNLD